MKYIIILVLAITSLTSNAIDLDIGLGYTWTEKPVNTLWYQNGFKNDIDNTSESWHIGIRFNAYENIEILAGYKYLGSFSSNALASSSDINYYQYVAGEADIWPLTTWKGKGKADGIYLLGQYNFKHFHIKGGWWLNRSTWSVYIPDWRCATNESGKCVADYANATYSAPSSIKVTADHDYVIKSVVGIGKRFGPISIDYEIWSTDRSGGAYPNIYAGHSQNLSISYIF